MRISIILLGVVMWAGIVAAQETPLQIGLAKADVTPVGPVRLCGYVARKTESEGVEQKLFARAIAIGSSSRDACVIIALDTTGMSGELSERVARRIETDTGVTRDRLVICASHSHATPCLAGSLVNMFAMDLPADQVEHIANYTKLVEDKLVEAGKAAIADMKPGTLSIARGEAGFAANRRTPGGPTDHEMPLLVAKSADGKIRGLVANYACHCTTLGPDNNKACGDWAGFAAEDLEKQNPGAIAMITIGCGADSNPQPRGKLDLAKEHGSEIAQQSMKLLQGPLQEIHSRPQARFKTIQLAFDQIPTRQEWETLAKRNDAVGYNAKTQLRKLDQGEKIPDSLPYPVQTITFGDELAMVFLGGEVVVDYALRLKSEFEPSKLWITSYSNDVCCYIPSRRILKEGGYEAEGAMAYYGRPNRLAPSVENDIIRTVHELLPTSFRSKQALNEFPLPMSVPQALAAFRTRADLQIEPVATEPLIVDPVAIDWDLQGRLWVLEMHDYPNGLHEDWKPGGRVKVLEDTDGDGRYDKATTFIDHLPFPQGLMVWRDGLLICAAPDILFARDTNGDGKADEKKTLFSGFSPDNQQWEVNGLAWGLDGWVYGASSIANNPIRIGETGKTFELGGRDFRMNPDTLAFEAAAGRTQFCRVRDDWNNWFGNDNSNPLFHYPLPEHYLRRNPHMTPPPPRVLIGAAPDPTLLYPASRLLPRYNNPESANRVTSGCGPGIYRDNLLGDEFYGNAFFCEPVHNLVQRLILSPKGASFTGRRAAENQSSEFLASTDNWFRPVQVRTGPDGALYVVDMYRFVIEHPRWITPERLARLDVRAGADKGRIYRIFPKGTKPRQIEDLSSLKTSDLAARMDSFNGTLRDTIHRELLHRADASAVTVLSRIADQSQHPAARLQALWALEDLGKLESHPLMASMVDAHAGVRRGAIEIAGRHGSDEAVRSMVSDIQENDPAIRFQIALTLGEFDDPQIVPDALAKLARSGGDAWMRAAIVSSAARCAPQLLARIEGVPGLEDVRRQLLTHIAATGNESAVASAIVAVIPAEPKVDITLFATAASLVEAMIQREVSLSSATPQVKEALQRLRGITDVARRALTDAKSANATKAVAVRLLGRDPEAIHHDVQTLGTLLEPQVAQPLQLAAIRALGRIADAESAQTLLGAWKRLSPAQRGPVVEAFLSRPAWVSTLIKAMRDGLVSPMELSASQRDRLLRQNDPALREEAAGLLAVHPSSRAQIIERFRPATTLKGNAAAGAAIFQKSCSACHHLSGVGNAVGPNLAALTDRSPAALLTAILDPNSAVDGKYLAYLVETTDDRALSGLVADETAAGLTIIQGNGLRETVPRSTIKKLTSTKLSLMPEGLEEGMTPQNLADLIAFIQQAREGK